jgi:hypothetical protein
MGTIKQYENRDQIVSPIKIFSEVSREAHSPETKNTLQITGETEASAAATRDYPRICNL